MPPFFEIRHHRVPAQHVREYEHGVANEDQDYYVEVNQYLPVSDRRPQPNDITLIAAVGMGMIKEIFEPLFQDLTIQCASKNVNFRGFWIADMGCIGKSAIVNANNLGNELSWFDHSRDLLHIINHFRREMPRPLVGLGHSMGGAQIAYLSMLHPHLFHTLILVEPAIYPGLDRDQSLRRAKLMSRRREIWPSKHEAEKSIRNNPIYKLWDPRVVDLLVKHNLVAPGETQVAVRVPPLSEIKGASEASFEELVVTTTPRDVEVNLMAKANFGNVGSKGLDAMSADQRSAVPDIDPESLYTFPWYRPEPPAIYKQIDTLRPSVCFIVGNASAHSKPEFRRGRLEKTGRGVGGSGGSPLGRVVERVIDGGGHYLLLDKHAPETVNHCTEWLEMEMRRWEEERRVYAEFQSKSPVERSRPPKMMLETLAQYHPETSPDVEAYVKSRI